MRRFWKKKEDEPLDKQIEAILATMERLTPSSPDYPLYITHLERLSEIKKTHRRDPVSSDTIALILGNLAGILLIVAYEQKHVMTSRGFTQLIQPKRSK